MKFVKAKTSDMWIARDAAGNYLASFSYSFRPNNSGAFFARNYGTGMTRVSASMGNKTIMEEIVHIHRFKRDADKWARAWFKAKDVRGMLTNLLNKT